MEELQGAIKVFATKSIIIDAIQLVWLFVISAVLFGKESKFDGRR